MNKQNLKIDPELQSLLPPLSEGEYQQLEDNIVNNGYDKNFPIMVWKGYIADGHNRYKICKDHNITDYTVTTLAYQTKEEVMEWMLDVQLGRRNLNKAQRVLAAEKFREYYERQARENMKECGALGGKKYSPKEGVVQMDTPFDKNEALGRVRTKLSDKAGVGSGTYYRCKTVLDSDHEELKQQMLSGEITINAAYNMVKENVKKKDETENESIQKVESNAPKSRSEGPDNNTTTLSTQNIDKKTENNDVIEDVISKAEVFSEPKDTSKDNKDVIKDVFDQSLPILDDKKIEDTKAVYEKELIHKQRNREDMKQVHQVCQELKRDNTVDVFHDRLVGYIKDINFILSSIQNDTGHTIEDLNNCISYVEDFYNSVKEIIENYK